jgi:hypothetical protein
MGMQIQAQDISTNIYEGGWLQMEATDIPDTHRTRIAKNQKGLQA